MPVEDLFFYKSVGSIEKEKKNFYFSIHSKHFLPHIGNTYNNNDSCYSYIIQQAAASFIISFRRGSLCVILCPSGSFHLLFGCVAAAV